MRRFVQLEEPVRITCSRRARGSHDKRRPRMRWEFLLSAIVITACSTSQPVAPNKPQAAPPAAAAEKVATTADSGEPMKKKDGTTVYCRRESVTNTRLRDRKV